jgi:YXWGXW repeat-containing protein
MRVVHTLALAISLIICSLLAFSPARAQSDADSSQPADNGQADVDVSVDVEPPPLPVYDQPPIPDPGYMWTPGYWAWDDATGYYWVPGTWVLPPEPELLWTPGYWGWDNGVYLFHRGYWGAHIGFYGGVAYGFGYTGDGYEGGYWRGGSFFYNRTVNNISNVRITNVYEKTVVVNNRTNVSFNGGTGGTTARATPEQLAAANERHIPPTAEQTRHVEMSAKDPSLALNSNHGHPAIAATAQPGRFSGPGVIAAHPGRPIAAVLPQGHRQVPPGNRAVTPGNRAVTPGNRAVTPGNKAGPEIREHRGNVGGGTPPGTGNPASRRIEEHKSNTGGGTPPGTGNPASRRIEEHKANTGGGSPPTVRPPPVQRAASPPPRPTPPPPPPKRPPPPPAKKCKPGEKC